MTGLKAGAGAQETQLHPGSSCWAPSNFPSVPLTQCECPLSCSGDDGPTNAPTNHLVPHTGMVSAAHPRLQDFTGETHPVAPKLGSA